MNIFSVVRMWLRLKFRFRPLHPFSLALSLPLSRSRSSHALWMSLDTASRVCGVYCLLRSNNILTSLAPCPAPARHLTAASHAWTPDTVTARTKSHSLVSNLCLQTDGLGSSPGVTHHDSTTTVYVPWSWRLRVTFVQRKSLNWGLDWRNDVLKT